MFMFVVTLQKKEFIHNDKSYFSRFYLFFSKINLYIFFCLITHTPPTHAPKEIRTPDLSPNAIMGEATIPLG